MSVPDNTWRVVALKTYLTIHQQDTKGLKAALLKRALAYYNANKPRAKVGKKTSSKVIVLRQFEAYPLDEMPKATPVPAGTITSSIFTFFETHSYKEADIKAKRKYIHDIMVKKMGDTPNVDCIRDDDVKLLFDMYDH